MPPRLVVLTQARIQPGEVPMRCQGVRPHLKSGLECLDGAFRPIESRQNEPELKMRGWKEVLETDCP